MLASQLTGVKGAKNVVPETYNLQLMAVMAVQSPYIASFSVVHWPSPCTQWRPKYDGPRIHVYNSTSELFGAQWTGPKRRLLSHRSTRQRRVVFKKDREDEKNFCKL